MLRLSLLIAFSFALAAAALSVARREAEEWSDFESDLKETVVFLRKPTKEGEDVFIRGGVENGKDCKPDEDPKDDPCAIPISHLELDIKAGTPQRDRWSESDLYLTWGGVEDGQHREAAGTPAQWTTSDQSNKYFHKLNKYGEHYWMVHFEMNCTALDNGGFFDFKGYLNGVWENDIYQRSCTGDAAEDPSYTSKNHHARCGYINVFQWNSNSCKMEEFDY